MSGEGLTNRDFSLQDKHFQNCCSKASKVLGKPVEPTRRQAGKFRNKRGLAYLYGREK